MPARNKSMVVVALLIHIHVHAAIVVQKKTTQVITLLSRSGRLKASLDGKRSKNARLDGHSTPVCLM